MAHMRKFASLPLAAVAAAALLLAPASAPAKAKPRCSTAGTTLAASKDVRIYTRGKSLDPVYACAYASGRKFDVGTFGECQSTLQFEEAQFAGRYLAVLGKACGAEDQSNSIVVWDVRTRKVVHRTPDSFGIGSFALAPSGAVAWIADDGDLEVRRIETGDTVEKLDSGKDIAPGSMGMASDGTIYWMRGGVVKSAAP
jgi:hypothetical protein